MRDWRWKVTVGEERRGEGRFLLIWWVLFDCLANVRRIKAYKQMVFEEVYLICTSYVRRSTCVEAGPRQSDCLSLRIHEVG